MDIRVKFSSRDPAIDKVLAFGRSGKVRQAKLFADRRAQTNPNAADILVALATVQIGARAYTDAQATLEKAVELDGQARQPRFLLGHLLAGTGRHGDALEVFESALELAAPGPADLSVLTTCALKTGNGPKAKTYAQALLRHDPSNAQARQLLEQALKLAKDPQPHMVVRRTSGLFYYKVGKLKQALNDLGAATELAPADGQSWKYLAVVHRELKNYQLAEDCIRRAIDEMGEDWESANILGLILQETNRFSEALDFFAKASDLNPENETALGNAVLAMHYLPDQDIAGIRETIDRHAARVSDGIKAKAWPAPSIGEVSAARPLRVGLLSGRFKRHPTLHLALAGLEHLDHQRFQLIAYSNGPFEDDYTQRLRDICVEWRRIDTMADDRAEALMHADALDLLIDMAGTTQGRPRLIARKPAPVIAKWVGGLYNTTGLDTVDWLIADGTEVPEDLDGLYTETVYRLPDGYVVYELPEQMPDVSALPALTNGHLTFACLNNAAKINRPLVRMWADILRQVDGSRLMLKSAGYSSDSLVEQVTGWFISEGIADDRLHIEGPSPHRALLRTYNRTDIALDTSPYSGGLTTCEALAMGNPVVAQPGLTFAGRHSASHLANIGRREWIAASPREYVEKVVALASDRDRLADIRANLRDEVLESPLCDPARFARNLEEGLLHMAQGPAKLA
ncbi:O-linked N-acetylglucosamine transferase, SPINDLY family protein [Maricaulis sp. CAU 1757]